MWFHGKFRNFNPEILVEFSKTEFLSEIHLNGKDRVFFSIHRQLRGKNINTVDISDTLSTNSTETLEISGFS